MGLGPDAAKRGRRVSDDIRVLHDLLEERRVGHVVEQIAHRHEPGAIELVDDERVEVVPPLLPVPRAGFVFPVAPATPGEQGHASERDEREEVDRMERPDRVVHVRAPAGPTVYWPENLRAAPDER